MVQGRKPHYGKKRWGNFDINEIVKVSNHPQEYTGTYLKAIFHAARTRKNRARFRVTSGDRLICSIAATTIKEFLRSHPKLETGFRKYTLETLARVKRQQKG